MMTELGGESEPIAIVMVDGDGCQNCSAAERRSGRSRSIVGAVLYTPLILTGDEQVIIDRS
jgi:hypothetical protein